MAAKANKATGGSAKRQPAHERYQQLTQVGRDTPMGLYLRCFWYPIAATVELKDEPVKAVTLLGEKLALFRTDRGDYGLVGQRCPHRGASLACGMAEEDNIRCAYHGWAFSRDGNCLDQPAEAENSALKREIKIDAYPVEVMGGDALGLSRPVAGAAAAALGIHGTRRIRQGCRRQSHAVQLVADRREHDGPVAHRISPHALHQLHQQAQGPAAGHAAQAQGNRFRSVRLWHQQAAALGRRQ